MVLKRTLAEQMGVGRPSIREAISALQIVGILESRPGDESYVTDLGGFDDSMFRALQQKYAMGRNGQYKDFILYDREFHLAIARATKSKAIVALLEELIIENQQPLFLNMREAYLKADPSRIKPMLELYVNIVKAIEDRDLKLAIHLKGYQMTNETTITINKKFSRPSAELLKPFNNIPTGYVVDVQGRRGALDCSIKPMFDFPSIAGPAVTVQTVPDDNLAPYLAMDVLQAGDVLVIANGGWTGSSVVGDLIAGMFKNIGVAAIVTDGAVRDVAGLEQVGVPVFARGLTANSPQKNGPGAVGLEVSIGGAVIRSGDLIVGDQDGVVVLPQGKISTAIEGLQAVREKERKLEALIAEGLTKPDWVKDYLASDGVQYID